MDVNGHEQLVNVGVRAQKKRLPLVRQPLKYKSG